jgi:uncharacterized protein YdeI (YjbR/CyaY-like superfamily)
LVVGFYKKHTGRPSITWPESVDEALCVGWIDGIRRRIDDEAYSIRFTPRRRGSNWSAVNIARMEALIAEGRVLPAGMKAWEARREDRSAVYGYEQVRALVLDSEFEARLRADGPAWEFFEGLPPSHRKQVVGWIMSAKREETRERRFVKALDMFKRGERF